MFVSGSMICLQSGNRVRVDDLRVGDRLVDPLTDVAGELVDIRWRDVTFSVAGMAIFSEFRPVRISMGALRNGVPECPLLVSPEQPILVPDPLRQWASTPAPRVISCQSLLGEPGISLATEIEACRYFALFFERPQFFDVGGVLFQGACMGSETLRVRNENRDIDRPNLTDRNDSKIEETR